MDEYLKFDQCTTTLSNAGSRALGAIINKFKSLKDRLQYFQTLV